jgi:hypothetical protein
MPAVGEDSDFERLPDRRGAVELSYLVDTNLISEIRKG